MFLAFFDAVRDAKDLSFLRFVDASFVKCSIASLTKRGAGPHEATEKTKGGFTTKVTAVCDSKQRVYACQIDPGNDNWNSPKKVDMDQTDRIVSLGVFSAFESVD